MTARMVHIPAEMRELTGGLARVAVNGTTLGEVIDRLERLYPGIHDRLVAEHHLRPGVVAILDAHERGGALQTELGEVREIFFIRPVSGGAMSEDTAL